MEGSGRASSNGLVEAFVEVARHLGRPVGIADVLRRVAYDENGLTLVALKDVAPGLGFDLHIAQITLKSLPAITLPVIVFDAAGHAIVLTAISFKKNQVSIVVPAEGAHARSVSLKAFAKQLSGIVVFVRPAIEQPTSIGARTRGVPGGHWFWSTFRAFRSDYVQVVLAAFLINMLGIVAPLFVKNVYDRVIPNLAIPTLWALTAGVLLALFLDVVLRSLRSSIVDATGRRVDLVVAGRLFEQVLNLKLECRPASAGSLASQLRDFDSVRDVLTSTTLIALTDLLFIGIFLGVMWMIVGPMAIVPLIAVAVVLVFSVAIQFPLARAVKASQADSAKRHGLLVEAASSIETIKCIGAEGQVRRQWDEAVAATSRTTTAARFWANLSANMVAFVNQAVSIATVVWGVYLVLDGSITVGALIAASILSGRVLAPLGSIVQTLARALQAWNAFKTLNALMSSPVERVASLDGRVPRSGDIVFKGVSLTYPGADIAALNAISLTIAKGERVGLIGKIGSGKTSVGRLLAGLYEPSAGQVLIDGMDVRQFGSDIRTIVGFCQQETELFSGTLHDNIVIGQPGAGAAAIERAVRCAGVDGFAARLPAGLATPVAERGRSLSGGQRQAIGLARILVRDPQILFLDEPSSAMDTSTERALVAALRRELDSGVTLVISTHRDGMLELVDRLIVFDGGRIMLDGPKADVIAQLREAARSSPVAAKDLQAGDIAR